MDRFDSFTLAVIIGDVLVVLALIGLIVMDKGTPPAPVLEPPKSAAKRPA